MEDFSDEHLVGQYRASPDSPAGKALIDQLFHRHHAKVAAWCYRLTGDVDIAADLAQEVFLKAFQRLDSYRGESKFTTWLYTIARNRCMDELRGRATDPDQNAAAIDEHMEDLNGGEISDEMERRESEALIRRLMKESLNDVERKVMTLHYVEELPLDAVTRVLGLTNASGAKAYIVSARRKLAKALAAWRSRERGLRGAADAR